jgi:hypothetical protein
MVGLADPTLETFTIMAEGKAAIEFRIQATENERMWNTTERLS